MMISVPRNSANHLNKSQKSLYFCKSTEELNCGHRCSNGTVYLKFVNFEISEI
jgi:hypothetical protein